MSIELRIFDKQIGAPEVAAPDLILPLERVSAREIVRRRVEAEVERYNTSHGETALFVTPCAEEVALNGQRGFRALDAEKQCVLAEAALAARRIVMLLDGRQIDDLDEVHLLTPQSAARFIRLVPLVGG